MFTEFFHSLMRSKKMRRHSSNSCQHRHRQEKREEVEEEGQQQLLPPIHHEEAGEEETTMATITATTRAQCSSTGSSASGVDQENKAAEMAETNGHRRPSTLTSASSKKRNSDAKRTMPLECRIDKLKERFRLDLTEAEKNGNLAVDERCCVCFGRTATVRTFPCGHQVLCRLCALTLVQSLFESGRAEMHCVLCRTIIVTLRHQKVVQTKGSTQPTKRPMADLVFPHIQKIRQWRRQIQ